MFRVLFLSAAVLVTMLTLETQTAGARMFSVNNPYTSFNLSGVNYGSMKWERERGNRANVFRSRGIFFRR